MRPKTEFVTQPGEAGTSPPECLPTDGRPEHIAPFKRKFTPALSSLTQKSLLLCSIGRGGGGE